MHSKVGRWVTLMVMTSGGVGWAQPAAPEPPASVTPPAPAVVSVQAPAESGYPLAYVRRPLLLPTGGIEGSALLVAERLPYPGSDPTWMAGADARLRYGAPQVELEAGVVINLYRTEPDSMFTLPDLERLGAVMLAARHGFGEDLSLGAELLMREPAGDYPLYGPRVTIAHRRHLSPWSAIELSAKAGIDRQSLQTGPSEETFQAAVLAAEVRVQAQLSDAFAVEGRAAYSVHDPFGEYPTMIGVDQGYAAQEYGVRAIAAVNRNVDVTAGFDVLSQQPYARFTIGLVARSVP